MKFSIRNTYHDLIDDHKHRNLGLILSFMVPVLLLYTVFVIKEIYPFGGYAFLPSDMYHQYAPFFSEFQYRLQNGGSLLYSWNLGLGVNFTALYAYYLSSPFNWLIALFPSGNVIEFMAFLVIFKMGLSGLTMGYYLQKHGNTRDVGVCFFAIFYALSGYMTAYSWNIMWLDCLFLFPLIILGMERLMRDGNGLLYCITLGLSIFTNYYIAMLICMFLVLYFFALLAINGVPSFRQFIDRGVKFTIFSLIAGGLGAVMLVPEIYALQMTAASDFTFPTTYTQYFSILEMLARHIGNIETEIGLDHWPNIFCGVAVFIFFLLYAANDKIKTREKAVYCTLLTFFLASFSINVLNFIWHGLRYPNSLPSRQSFIYIFLLLTMCYKVYQQLDTIPFRHIALAFWGAVGFVLLAQHIVTAEHFHFAAFYGALAILAVYICILAAYKKGTLSMRAIFLIALAAVSLEAGLNLGITSISAYSRSGYTRYEDDIDLLMEDFSSADTFFRVKNVDAVTKDEGGWSNYPSASLFSSMANESITKLYKNFGGQNSVNAYGITGSTPLMDSLLSVRYTLSPDALSANEFRTLYQTTDSLFAYENTNILPLGFWVPSDFEDSWTRSTNPISTQNNLAHAMGAENILVVSPDTKLSGTVLSFTPQEDGEYFAYMENKNIKKLTVVCDEETSTYTNVNQGYLIPLGQCSAGDLITLRDGDGNETANASVYRFSAECFDDVYTALAQSPWTLSNWDDTTLEGAISCTEDGLLYTSIPYDAGWTVTVDGAVVETQPILDAFISVPLTAGTHQITMTYLPQGLVMGGAISAVSLVTLLSIAGYTHLRKKQVVAPVEVEEPEHHPEDV